MENGEIHDALLGQVKEKSGKNASPIVGIIDSQSIKTVQRARGYDAGKKVKGRKRHITTDILGLVLSCEVHGADVQDRDGANVLTKAKINYPTIVKFFADGGYAGYSGLKIKTKFCRFCFHC